MHYCLGQWALFFKRQAHEMTDQRVSGSGDEVKGQQFYHATSNALVGIEFP